MGTDATSVGDFNHKIAATGLCPDTRVN